MKHRELTFYKYQMLERYSYPVELPDASNNRSYVWIKDGILWIKEGYAWDGASFPAINTLNFRQGSLVHDALYQLMREGDLGVKYKDYADRLLVDICRDDGMNKFRAWYVYQAVKWFGGWSMFPSQHSWLKRIYYWFK